MSTTPNEYAALHVGDIVAISYQATDIPSSTTGVIRQRALTDVELNEALAQIARRHLGDWDHPRRVAIREEMLRRKIAGGRTCLQQ